jgi:ankyrin repeat protein/Mg2+ and Co2+ transporter CorA
MARSPSRSSDGGNPGQHDRPEPRLLKAIEEKKNDDAIAIIEHARAKAESIEHLLRIGLMRCAERGNVVVAEYLLKSGAKPDGGGGAKVSPLLKAVEKNNVGIVSLLLKYGGNVDVADKQGRTALMTAAWRNHFHILNELVRCGADVNKKDHKGRNVLHNLAADKHRNWGRDVIDLLLRTKVPIDGSEGQDDLKRSPLHWATVTGNKSLCEQLLRRGASVNATEIRDKTSLHLAVSHERDDIVEMLLAYGADVNAKSDGSWTALHNACEHDNVKVVRMLLTAGASLNARLLNGMTPLHVAAQAGHLEIVKCLLERKDLKRTARDTFGMTAFLRAASIKRRDIANVLAPDVDTLSEDALGACNGFNATIVDFGHFHNDNRVSRRTVYELLYGRDPVNNRKPAVSILPTQSKATSFRWIHLPANNMAWVESLLVKMFIEEGASDVEGFKALERSFSHVHKGQLFHSHFMRPLCQSIPRAPRQYEESDLSDGAEQQGVPPIYVSSGLGISTTAGAQENIIPRTPIRTGTVSTDQTDWTQGSTSGRERKDGKIKEKSKKLSKWSNSRAAKPSGGTDSSTKYSDHNSRRKASDSLQSSGHLRSPGSPGKKDPTQAAKGNIFTFMPYLHFESDRSRKEMQNAILRAQMIKDREKHEGRFVRPLLKKAATYDEMLLRAHLTSSHISLHVRRTLDQFFYHNIDTRSRDQDQVVYRYQTQHLSEEEKCDADPKIFMVDQLWMWILGKDLVVTAFPQRWEQPKNDPLNVLDGIIEDINSKTREPVRSVHDLSMIIAGRCSGVFDRRRDIEEYQFLDMFESSIGDATELETILFNEFNEASRQASAWLQHHRRPNRFSQHLEAEGRNLEHRQHRHRRGHTHDHALATPPIREEQFRYDPNTPAHAPLFVDQLLDIGAETDLLAEIKDIRDELNMIAKVLEDQRSVLPDLEASITDIYREEHKSREDQQDLKRRSKDQLKIVDIHLKDLKRMDTQAERIYKSITDLLDLKQKHANAFEARFARDQAAGTARQSQTIMVFTIVTIIFLPLSFIAAIFTINIKEFPHDGGNITLPFSYVSKFIFGIGLAISIPLVFVALSVDAIGDFFREFKRRFSERSNRLPEERRQSAIGNGNGSLEKLNEMRAMEIALSVGRSTRAGGRRSIESYLGGGSLLPVMSRGTVRTGAHGSVKNQVIANGGINGGINGNGNGTVSVERPAMVERMSTGFRIRRSADVERGI